MAFGDYYFYSDETKLKIKLEHYEEVRQYYKQLEYDMQNANLLNSRTEYSRFLKDYSQAIKNKPSWVTEAKYTVTLANTIINTGNNSIATKKLEKEMGITHNVKK